MGVVNFLSDKSGRVWAVPTSPEKSPWVLSDPKGGNWTEAPRSKVPEKLVPLDSSGTTEATRSFVAYGLRS